MNTAIIIGGGVIGLSTAYHLALRNFGRIILLEKGVVGDGSSSRAAGGITGLLWTDTGVAARKISLARFRELSDELDGYRFQDVGCLNLFDLASWPEREKLLPIYDRQQAPYEIIDAAEMRRRWPQLTPSEDMVGLYDPLGGYSEPHEYIPAITRKIRGLGVDVRENQQVTGFQIRNGGVVGVKTAAGNLEAEAVIVTVHVWALRVLESLGLRLPLKFFVHQRWVTKPLALPLRIPLVNANPWLGYVRPAYDGRALVGFETADREEFRVPSADYQMTGLAAPAGLRATLRDHFSGLTPSLRLCQWESEKVGLLSFTMDGEPIVGPVHRLPGLFVGASFQSGGFAYNPVVGLLLAEMVADKKTRIDATAFSPDRFQPADVEKYLGTTLQQGELGSSRHRRSSPGDSTSCEA